VTDNSFTSESSKATLATLARPSQFDQLHLMSTVTHGDRGASLAVRTLG
jgi:hypothetical protein